MSSVGGAARGGVSFLVIFAIVLGVILLAIILLDGFFQLFSGFIISLIGTIGDALLAIAIAIGQVLVNIILGILGIAAEGLVNLIIRSVNALIPGTLLDIPFVDITGDDLCFFSGVGPNDNGCNPGIF